MAYAILRTKKLKSLVALARSARHTFREQETLNADPEATPLNITLGARGETQVTEAFERGLPEKRRKDAVIGIEYLITASPEAFKRHGGHLDDMGNGYFDDAIQWLRERHGADNVISTTIHLDEITPHLVAYVIPKTADGRLCAREFLGGTKVMRELQDGFHVACGEPRGLIRGVRGSNAKHDKIKSFYGLLNEQAEPPVLNALDYAGAAIGIKTENKVHAEAFNQAMATEVLMAQRRQKAEGARSKALDRMETELKSKEADLVRRAQALDSLELELKRREQRLRALEDSHDYAVAS